MTVSKSSYRRSRVFAGLLAAAGIYSLVGSWPSHFYALGGLLGLASAAAAMWGQETVRWPLALGMLASAGAVAALMWPHPQREVLTSLPRCGFGLDAHL